jgi:GPH family glycoside/pentoside/hexuronide:cation symporter
MAAELTKDYDERTSLMTVASIGAVLGYMIGSISVRLIVGNAATPQIGYMIVGGIFGILAGLSVAFVAWRVKEPTNYNNVTSKMPLVKSIKTTFKNKPFVMLISAFFLTRLAFTLMQAVMIYFVVYNIGESRDSIGKLLTIIMLVIGAFIIVWNWVGKHLSKSLAYVIGLSIVAICLFASFWIGNGDMNILLIIGVVLGIGMSSHWVMPFAMMPDVIEYDEIKTGERREGIFYGVYGLTDKVSRTLAIIILGFVLEIFNYVPNVEQTAESLLGIRLLFGPVPAALILLALPILIFYPINRKAHASMIDSLEKGNTLSEEEIEESWKQTA